eukprot:9890431-Alexandrium_andersonii.AAC.1
MQACEATATRICSPRFKPENQPVAKHLVFGRSRFWRRSAKTSFSGLRSRCLREGSGTNTTALAANWLRAAP